MPKTTFSIEIDPVKAGAKFMAAEIRNQASGMFDPDTRDRFLTILCENLQGYIKIHEEGPVKESPE